MRSRWSPTHKAKMNAISYDGSPVATKLRGLAHALCRDLTRIVPKNYVFKGVFFGPNTILCSELHLGGSPADRANCDSACQPRQALSKQNRPLIFTSEQFDSLLTPEAYPCPSGFVNYVAASPLAPLYLGSSRCARPLPARRYRPCRSSQSLHC